MKAIVNGLEIGWDGITPEEFEEQREIALLPEMRLGKGRDLRREKPYGRLIPLYRVVPDKQCLTRNARWLCRCTCEKYSLTVVMAHNLQRSLVPTEGCGCVHRIRASQNLAALKQNADFKQRQSKAASAGLKRYHREHPEEVKVQARKNGHNAGTNPHVVALREERVRQQRIARNFDPDIAVSTRYVLIRHAIKPLTQHILRVRDKFTCALCEKHGRTLFAVHHVIPVEAEWAGVGDPSNLVTLCFSCHFKRAHAGDWRTVDPLVQAELLLRAREREDACPAHPEIVRMVQGRLDTLSQKLGLA